MRARLWLVAACLAAGPLLKQGWLAAAAKASAPQKTFHYDSEGKRDPFVPLIINNRRTDGIGGSVSGSDSGRPVLHGILWDPSGNSIALVDNTEAKVGDIVRGYQIKMIKKDAVVLEAEGQTVVLDIAFDAQKPSATTKEGHP